MAARHFSLTLTGAVQRLTLMLGADDQTPGGKNDLAYRQLIFATDPANAAAVYVGATSSVSSTDHGFALDPTQATARDRESIGPFDTGPVRLSDFYVLGTNAERLHVLGIPF